jgi:hypothetical protein
MKPPHHRQPPESASGDDPDSPALEALLSARRLRQPPAEWRDAILRQAIANAGADPDVTMDRDGEVGRDLPPSLRYGGQAGARRHGDAALDGAIALPWKDSGLCVAQPSCGTPDPGPIHRLLEYLTSGWSLTAATWVLALALNQYSIPHGAFKPSTPPPPFSDAALAEIRESQRALGDLANVNSLSPAHFSSPNPRQAPSESSLPASPILPPGDRPRARLPRGLREWHLAELDGLDHSEPDLQS